MYAPSLGRLHRSPHEAPDEAIPQKGTIRGQTRGNFDKGGSTVPKPLILATDLDGTLLGGQKEAKERLYRRLSRRSKQDVLIFVTGRDLGFIQRIIQEDGVPRPDYIIGDVGTSVFEGKGFSPYHPIESDIARNWQDKPERVHPMLDRIPGLTPQPGPFRHRLSYYYDKAFDPRTLDFLKGVEVDVLMSAGVYLDILPKGVNKGTTLLRLLDALTLPKEAVVCAGDTLNDLALFETGLHGIVVGNAEPALVQKTAAMPNLYHSVGHGTGGILEGLIHFGYEE